MMTLEATDDRWLWVSTWRPVPLRALAHLLSRGLTLDRAFGASRAEWADALRALGSNPNPPSLAEALASPPSCEWTRATRATLERLGASIVTWADEDYPQFLRPISDPPPVLFVTGSLARERPVLWPEACAAVVGARRASPSGLEISSWIAGGLAARGVCVVSGLARGVDAAAHRGALAAGGVTIAVLGSGLDVLYPPEHAALAREVCAHGLLVSEFAPDTPALREFFPRRNRIISGLSRATVVVEASSRSGALVTARLAMEQGRDVLAVPRDPLQAGCEGPNALLADGAAPARSADDVCAAMGLPAAPRAARGDGTAEASLSREGTPPAPAHAPKRTGFEAKVLGALDGRARSLEEIAKRTDGGRPAELLAVLAALEVDGAVERVPGPRFRRRLR